MKLKLKISVLAVLILFLEVISQAQCSTCAAATESSLQSGSTAAKGLNNGILYLFAMPFLFALVMFILYRNRKKYLAKFDD